MGEKPFVTIGVIAYNAESTIAETLASLVAQDYPNREIIVADNASTDRTGDIIRSFGPMGVRYRRHPSNIGPGGSFNWLIRSAGGEFVTVYHADDVYLPTIVSREAEFLLSHPEVGAVFALDQQIDTKGAPIGESVLPKELKGLPSIRFDILAQAILKYGNTFLRTPSFMVRKRAFPENMLDSNEEGFGTGADIELWLRLCKHAPIGIIEEILFKYRRSPTQHTSRIHQNRTQPWEHFLAVDHHLVDCRERIPQGLLKDYEDHKMNDIAYCASNLFLSGSRDKALRMLRPTISSSHFRSSIGSPARLIHFLARLSFFASAKAGLGKPFASLLRKFV